jgi:hypothetical protein
MMNGAMTGGKDPVWSCFCMAPLAHNWDPPSQNPELKKPDRTGIVCLGQLYTVLKRDWFLHILSGSTNGKYMYVITKNATGARGDKAARERKVGQMHEVMEGEIKNIRNESCRHTSPMGQETENEKPVLGSRA